MLFLDVRMVLSMNIARIDFLGAFNGATDCRYHYDPPGYPYGCACAIGIVDAQNELNGMAVAVRYLREFGFVQCCNDEINILMFIQAVHDRVVVNNRREDNTTLAYYKDDWEIYLARRNIDVPNCVKDLLKSGSSLDKRAYRRIMWRLQQTGMAVC